MLARRAAALIPLRQVLGKSESRDLLRIQLQLIGDYIGNTSFEDQFFCSPNDHTPPTAINMALDLCFTALDKTTDQKNKDESIEDRNCPDISDPDSNDDASDQDDQDD